MHPRKDLCADALNSKLRSLFSGIADSRKNPKVSLEDTLMGGYALFSLKLPSLLKLDQLRNEDVFANNLRTLFGIEHIPSDTGMRETLDEVNPDDLRPAFTELFKSVQRGKCLENFVHSDGTYLLALDGTGYFSSKSIHCDSCQQKVSKKTGEVTYEHQMLGGVIVHPQEKTVIPLCPEPILRQGGDNKNDSERCAATRSLEKVRNEHQKVKSHGDRGWIIFKRPPYSEVDGLELFIHSGSEAKRP